MNVAQEIRRRFILLEPDVKMIEDITVSEMHLYLVDIYNSVNLKIMGI